MSQRRGAGSKRLLSFAHLFLSCELLLSLLCTPLLFLLTRLRLGLSDSLRFCGRLPLALILLPCQPTLSLLFAFLFLSHARFSLCLCHRLRVSGRFRFGGRLSFPSVGFRLALLLGGCLQFGFS